MAPECASGIFCHPFSRENGSKGRVVFPFLHTAMGWGKVVQCEFGKALVSLGMNSSCLGLGGGAGLGCPAMDAFPTKIPFVRGGRKQENVNVRKLCWV